MTDGNCLWQYSPVTPSELKRARSALGMTQTELAHEVGVTQNTVARWEMGVRGIPEPAARLIGRLMTERRPKKRKK